MLKNKNIFILFLILTSINLAFSIEYLKVRYNKVNDSQIAFYADNANYCPYQILIKPELSPDMTSDAKFPLYKVIEPQKTDVYLFSINSKNIIPDNKKIIYYLNYYFGDPEKNNIDENFPYLLPYEEGKILQVAQGYNTSVTHKGWIKYSIDFGMNLGTPICASRDGVVVAVKDDSNIGGPSSRYSTFANYILIYHEDGTFSDYLHLKKSGCSVKVGDIVKAGDVIGYSGNTGMSRGPHLHFMVFKPLYMTYMTVPVKYLSDKGSLISLEYKKSYISYHKNSNIITDDKNITVSVSSETSDNALGGY
jgi:hypothetical protein